MPVCMYEYAFLFDSEFFFLSLGDQLQLHTALGRRKQSPDQVGSAESWSSQECWMEKTFSLVFSVTALLGNDSHSPRETRRKRGVEQLGSQSSKRYRQGLLGGMHLEDKAAEQAGQRVQR